MANLRKPAKTFGSFTRLCCRFASSDSKPNIPKRVPVHEREDTWKSKLAIFAPDKGKAMGPEIINFFRGPDSFKEWFSKFMESYEVHQQRYIPLRHDILGSDLATAHFIVHRDGSVKFCGTEDWTKKDKNGEYKLPDKYVPDMFLEAVDASNTELRYEGLVNFKNLQHLKWLSLRGCPHIDDWCLDRISGELKTLEYLDISDCKKISYRGLSSFYRLGNLRTLKVHNISSSREFEFMCLLLEDLYPGLVIEGVKYIDIKESDM